MKKAEIRINGQLVDVDDSFEYRLSRFIQSEDNFAQKGGNTTTDIRFPASKRNKRVFRVNDHRGTIDKFNRARNFIGEISIDGNVVMRGELKLSSITRDAFIGNFLGEDVQWITDAGSINLNEIGLVDGVPTWTAPFEGGDTMNIVNEQSNRETSICFPTVLYNNTPITDYLDYTETEIFGTFDVNGEQLVEPLDFPNIFPLKRGFFGLRQGLTFEDFPPAVYYRNLLEKCLEEVGLTLTGEITTDNFFNAMVLPYVGNDPYNWNWKKLAQVYAELNERQLHTANQNQTYGGVFDFNSPRVSTTYNFLEAESLLDNPALHSLYIRFFSCANLVTFDDNIANRVDRVGTFRPYLVGDKTGQYVCPTDGRYTFRVKSYATKTITVTNEFPDFFGDEMFNRDTRWGEQILCIVRHDTDGQFVFDDDLYRSIGRYIVGQSSPVDDTVGDITQPSDLIAWFSPKRYAADPQTGFGSPLTDNQSNVNIDFSAYTESTTSANPIAELTSASQADINITLDMEANERVSAVWVTLSQYAEGDDEIPNFQINREYYRKCLIDINDEESVFEVNYECGIEDLDIAGNLPEVSILQFLGNFLNYFNLSFEVKGNEFRVFSNKSYYISPLSAFDISAMVDVNSIEISAPKAYKKLTVGYENDSNDKLLLLEGDDCVGTSEEVINYANYNRTNDGNVYADGELEVTNGFSATKFSKGNIKLVDISTMVLVRNYVRNPFNLNQLFETGLSYGGTYKNYTYELPTIQSIDSFEEKTLEDLNYEYSYSPRIFYHLGTKNTIEGISDNFRFTINAPTFDLKDQSRFWLKPTVSAFDVENNNPYRTLRYDGVDGLYNFYFNDEIEISNRSHILTASIFLSSTAYNNLTGGRLVHYDGDTYRLLEISDFDPTEMQPATIKLIKLI